MLLPCSFVLVTTATLSIDPRILLCRRRIDPRILLCRICLFSDRAPFQYSPLRPTLNNSLLQFLHKTCSPSTELLNLSLHLNLFCSEEIQNETKPTKFYWDLVAPNQHTIPFTLFSIGRNVVTPKTSVSSINSWNIIHWCCLERNHLKFKHGFLVPANIWNKNYCKVIQPIMILSPNFRVWGLFLRMYISIYWFCVIWRIIILSSICLSVEDHFS